MGHEFPLRRTFSAESARTVENNPPATHTVGLYHKTTKRKRGKVPEVSERRKGTKNPERKYVQDFIEDCFAVLMDAIRIRFSSMHLSSVVLS